MAERSPAPSLSAITANADGSLHFHWSYFDEWPDISIQRSEDGLSYYTIDTVTNSPSAEYTDLSTALDTRYWYRVKPFGYMVSNSENEWTYPGAVTGLTAVKKDEVASVDLAWVNGSTGGTSTIYWKKHAATTWNHSNETFSESLTITDLDEGEEYDFKVAILGRVGAEGVVSNVASATVDLIAPTLLEAHSNTSTVIHLTWSDNSGFETGVEIYRDGELIATVAADVESYLDDPVVYEQTYAYKIRAIKDAVVSAWTAEVDCTAGVAPGSPTGLAVDDYTFGQIDLDWTLADIYADYIDLYQKITATGEWALLSALPGDSVSVSVTGLDPVTDYYYKLRARNTSGQSPETGAVGAVTDPNLTPPADFNAVAVSDSQIELTWTPDWEDDVLVWEVERKVPGGAWEAIETTDALVHSYLDGGLAPYILNVQGTYVYRIRGVYGATEGGYTSEVTESTKSSGTVPDRQDAFFAMGPYLCLMADDLVGAREITREWYSKEFDFSNLDPKFFHTWKFIDRIQLEYENTASQVSVTIGISTDYGVTWFEKTKTLGDATGGSAIKDFRGFVHPTTGLVVPCVPGVYFIIRIKCTSSSGDLPWTGAYIWFDQGAEHFDTGLQD
jgi:hypothetical protein